MTSGQIGNVDLVKQLNSAAVFRLIDQQNTISRIQIAEISNLAPASVTKITRQLLERGLIVEEAQLASTGGRRAISLKTQSQCFHSVAVRIGRDKAIFSLFDLSANILAQLEESYFCEDQESLVDYLLFKIKSFIHEHQNKIQELIAIAVVFPGLINPDLGVVNHLPHIKVSDLPLAKLLKDEFNIPCFVGNDTRARALAEHYFGASKDHQDSIMISVRNGIGAGIIMNKEVVFGCNHNVGEIGHIQIDPLGVKCQCGNFGCLETITSNPAIIQQAKNLILQGHDTSLRDIENFTVSDICQAANRGDQLAKQVLVNVANYLGKAIALTVNLFNPQLVVISGKITEAQDIIFPVIQHCIKNQTLQLFHQELPIVASSLTSTPTLGAFAIIKRAMLDGSLLQNILEQ